MRLNISGITADCLGDHLVSVRKEDRGDQIAHLAEIALKVERGEISAGQPLVKLLTNHNDEIELNDSQPIEESEASEEHGDPSIIAHIAGNLFN